MQNIKGKIIAITGASSGMGKAIAVELAKEGAKVVLGAGFVKTDFANGIKNEHMKTAIKNGMEQMAINPIAIANAVIYAVSQPDDVEIGDIVIRPSKQN